MEGDDLRVGFIGLGSQGGPMAQAIIDAGFATTLWARRPKALVPYRSKADLADSPADLAARSDMVGICVLSDADVEEVVLGPNGLVDGVRPGTVVAIHSTVHPRTCIQMASVLAEAGADVLDAPVSGGGGAAAARKLLVMVGGDPAVLERARPVLESFGDPIVHLGSLGCGQTAKLANNLLFMGNMSLAHRIIEIGVGLGHDPASLISTLQHGSSRSFALDTYAGMRSGFDDPATPLAGVADVLAKDLRLFESLVEEEHVDSDLLTGAAATLLEAMVGGGQSRGVSSLPWATE